MMRALFVLALAMICGPARAQEARPHLELPQQSLTDGQKVKLGPMSIPNSKAERDQRPLMIGGGIVVLAAAMWWNRRRRERFDRSDAVDAKESTRATTESREDSDDLQAAARGEAKDDET